MIVACDTHGLRYDSETQNGCVLCRREEERRGSRKARKFRLTSPLPAPIVGNPMSAPEPGLGAGPEVPLPGPADSPAAFEPPEFPAPPAPPTAGGEGLSFDALTAPLPEPPAADAPPPADSSESFADLLDSGPISSDASVPAPPEVPAPPDVPPPSQAAYDLFDDFPPTPPKQDLPTRDLDSFDAFPAAGGLGGAPADPFASAPEDPFGSLSEPSGGSSEGSGIGLASPSAPEIPTLDEAPLLPEPSPPPEPGLAPPPATVPPPDLSPQQADFSRPRKPMGMPLAITALLVVLTTGGLFAVHSAVATIFRGLTPGGGGFAFDEEYDGEWTEEGHGDDDYGDDDYGDGEYGAEGYGEDDYGDDDYGGS